MKKTTNDEAKYINIETEKLREGLGHVLAVVPASSALPILGNVLMCVQAGKLRLAATNLEQRIEWKTAVAGDEALGVCVSARTLSALVGGISSENVDLGFLKDSLTVTGGGVAATFPTMDANEFPPPAQQDKKQIEIALESVVLRGLIQQVAFAQSLDKSRVQLNGVCLQLGDDGTVRAVATDGKHLAVAEVPQKDAVKNNMDIILPTEGVAALLTSLPDDTACKLSCGERSLTARIRGLMVSTSLVQGPYANWRQVVPEFKVKDALVIDPAAFRECLQRAMVFCTPTQDAVTLTAKGKKLAVAVKSDIGTFNESIPVESNPVEREPIIMTGAAVAEALGVVEKSGEVALIQWTASCDPFVLTKKTSGFIYVRMPMRMS